MITAAIWMAAIGVTSMFELDKKGEGTGGWFLLIACILATIGVNR